MCIRDSVSLDAPKNAEVIRVRTAQEMRNAVFARYQEASAIIMCAAVADFRPVSEAVQKIKKTSSGVSLELEPTPDILAELGRARGDRILIGFAAETENLREHARQKLERKNCDMIVANLVGLPGSGFESDSNQVVLALRTGESIEIPLASKRAVADSILNQIPKLRAGVASAR
jgi:phosphopantothenoylcysteine decarboxylase/phosphopantothenate--cysteine ligase